MKINLEYFTTKRILIIAALLVVAVLVYFIVRRFVKSLKSDSYQKQIADEVKADELSYPLNQYVSYADQLEDAMAYLGTDNSKVKSVITKMNNLSDLLQLIKAFGTRKYYLWGGQKTLPQWFMSELDNSELQEINNILKQRSINFSF